MLSNRWVQIGAVVALIGALAYNAWFFFLQEEDGPSTAGGEAGGGGGPPAAEVADDTAPPAAGEGLASLLSTAEQRRVPLRSRADLQALDRWRSERPEWGRDPFGLAEARTAAAEDTATLPDSIAAQRPQWTLTAILTSRDTRIATIDGDLYWEGDELEPGGEVVAIRESEVVVRWYGQDIVLGLEEGAPSISIQRDTASRQ